jgi:uncharacterized protein (TIGR00251 family)
MNAEMSAGLSRLVQEFRSKGSLVLAVKVIPRAQRNEVAGFLEDGSLKLKVAAVPEKDAANHEVCRIVAELFDVAERNVAIVGGRTSQRKRVSVAADV